MSEPPRMPNDEQRHLIVGRTGSGKTQKGMWALSHRSYDRMPWLIYDYKGDALIRDVDPIEIEPGKIPTKPGLYVTRPNPGADDELVERSLWKARGQGDIGLYIDEGYMVGRDNLGLMAVLTQGRSLRVPVIMLSQRPVWLSRFAFSEADFFSVFHLNDKRDRQTITTFMRDVTPNYSLPEYHSLYYDVGRDDLRLFKPVPAREQIIETFLQRRGKRVRTI